MVKFENSQLKIGWAYSLIKSLPSNVLFYCYVDNTLITFYNSLLGGMTYHILYYMLNTINIFNTQFHIPSMEFKAKA